MKGGENIIRVRIRKNGEQPEHGKYWETWIDGFPDIKSTLPKTCQ